MKTQWCWGCGCSEGAASGDMPTVSPGDWATAKLLAKKRGRGGYNYEVSCDGRFQPPNTLLKQGGLQLAEVSFREMLNCLLPQPNNMQPETVWQVALRSIQSSDLVLAPMLCDHWNEDAESAPAKTSWAGWRQPQYNKFSGISSPVTFGEEVTSLNRSVGKRLL